MKSSKPCCAGVSAWAAAGELAWEVFDEVFNETETFREDHVGSDLAYLMGAILDGPAGERGSVVEWHEGWEILRIFRDKFSPHHPVWKYIIVSSEEEGK